MVEYLGLHASAWKVMTGNWWNLILSGLALASIVVGSIFVLMIVIKQIKGFWHRRRRISKVPRNLAKYLENLKRKTPQTSQKTDTETPKTFGVFLGAFHNPPTPNEERLLSNWDSIVLDPFQTGVSNALASRCTSSHILGRIDVGMLLRDQKSTKSPGTIKSFDTIAQTIQTYFQRRNTSRFSFTGILLADWSSHFPSVIFNELVKYTITLGLDVYLEIAAPTFLTEEECREIDFSLIKGIVCRNGSILPDGERRNYFQMLDMRRALRALKVQTIMTGSTVMFWETIEDDAFVELQHSVVTRSFTWCKFNSVISWIGPKTALVDAEVATARTIKGEPLGAMMWLKDDEVMKVQDAWRLNEEISKTACDDHSIYDSLHSFIPNLRETLSLQSSDSEHELEFRGTTLNGFEWRNQASRTSTNPFSTSPHGNDYTGLGCFQLGLDCAAEDVEELIQTQRRLRDLGLLKCVPSDELRALAAQLDTLYKTRTLESCSLDEAHAMNELIRLILTTNGDENDRIRVYKGLDSGYRTEIDSKFWGLYDVDVVSGTTDLYISEKTADVTSTILHTFMSRMGCTRAQCYMAEIALSEHNGSLTEGTWTLAPRIVHDIKLLSPTELLLFLQHLTTTDCEDNLEFMASVRSLCEYQLIEVPSLTQLRALNSTAYLKDEISVEELVCSRLAWYREHGCEHPASSPAISFFKAVENRLSEVLLSGKSEILSQLGIVLRTILQKNRIDASADLFALSIFCAFRKLALSEVYMEIMDRNPLPNAHSDQAACFAEMFALGSRCENYFDVTPNVLGDILSRRIFAYYKANQPPRREDGFTELPTAYSSNQIDLDLKAEAPTVPLYYQITFIGIFAVPAFIDILLLTIIGRGLYVSSYMPETEKTIATTALMMSLLLTGGIGTWIGSGGSYYLHSMAFPAMNMFVLTRFIAGIAIALAGGLLSFIIIGIVKGFYASIVFFLYFFILSMYLTLLATLAIYQYPGYMFQSGRVVIMTRIPILFISPILTLFIGHDLIVYLCVLAGFLVSLFHGARGIISQWSTWYLNIPSVTDHEVVDWYTEKKVSTMSHPDNLGGTIDLAATPLPRRALLADVLEEHNRRLGSKSTSDEFVLRLAKGYTATTFLMDWYCKYSRTEKPYPYSPTWNLQCKAAVQTLLDMQKGLKFHNAFIHWRFAGDEVWCGILYFVIALLDKWVALMTGASVVGLSDASNETFRLSVGFGLAYYLVGAVCLDAVAFPLWSLANKKMPQPITSVAFLRQAAINDAKAKRSLYLRNLLKFFCLHIWGLSIFAALMWTFDNSQDATIMYLCYVFAYTGLLLYQYNRIFAGPAVLKDLILAVIVGLLVGLLTHRFLPHLAFTNVSALGSATWTAAFLSIWSSKLHTPTSKNETSAKTAPAFYSCSTLDPNPQLSQIALSETFDSICSLPAEWCYRLDPMTYPGVEVMEILRSRGNHSSPLVQAALASGEHLLLKTAELWNNGQTIIDLVPSRLPVQKEHSMRAISRASENQLHIFVFIGLDIVGDEWVMDIHRNCKVVAEAVIKSTAESLFGFSHDHATLAEILATNDNFPEELSVPDGVKRQLETSVTERARVIKDGDKSLLRYVLLGIDCEKDWDNLPTNIRCLLLKRCCGDRCALSEDQLDWIRSTFTDKHSLDIEEFIAQCNLGATLTTLTTSYATTLEAVRMFRDQPELPDSSYNLYFDGLFSPSTPYKEKRFIDLLKRPLFKVYHALRLCLKFFVVSLVADPEFQRELDYFMKSKPWFIRWPAVFSLNMVWNYTKTLQQIILPLVLFHDREKVCKLYDNMQGIKTVMKRNRIVLESLDGTSTCFVRTLPDGNFRVTQYSGTPKHEPEGRQTLKSINVYTDKLLLRRREEYAWESIVNVFEYEYPNENARHSYTNTSHRLRKPSLKMPIQRRCVEGALKGQIIQYDRRGYINSGSIIKDDNPVEFQFWYRKNAGFGDELLRAEYVLPFITVQVFWCIPNANHPEKLDRWIPHSKVMQATFIQADMLYEVKWHYDHKFHPIITTILNGEEVPTPPMIQHDWLGVLQKPKDFDFISDNPFLSFKSLHTNFFSRMLGLNTRSYPISTAQARTHLWKSWKNGKDLDAVTARWLDEISLRSEKKLKSYWRNRDFGRLRAAHSHIESHADTIMARVEIEPEISSWTPLAFKISDLLSFGQGGDTRINTRTITTQLQDRDNKLNVLAMDTGTWPNEGGGVSACRRDMVNNLDTIRWHIIAESANDFGVPKFQIEKNVQSLTILPLWGMDFLTPTHGMFQDHLDSAVQKRSHDTRDVDIKKRFLPILTTLVRCSRAVHLGRHHIDEATKAMVDLNTYFETSRHWSDVWMSDIVKEKWRELWLAEDMENTRPVSEWLDAERPTIAHLDNALDMWQRYLFIFSIPVPEHIPDVFQASHHFAGASYGVVCKMKRNCTLHVWDHCISWREVTVFLSSAMSFDTPFVCTALMSLSRVASVVILHHADVVLPCADFFNPGWEVELGSGQGEFEHRKTFARKIDPVVNGITGMENFKPIETIKSKLPTVVMLSHVRFVKDIKTAILAADIIVNDWGISDYRLDIYGDMERAPTYAVECQEIIASKSLRGNVSLKGLPLAMGEAALTGVPVVCTDVGASFRVVTDPVTGRRFSAVVPPNDAISLAKAQVNVLALLDEWAEFAEDAPGYHPKLPAHPTSDDVKWIMQRMYEKTEQRRRLGMMGRANILSNFSSERYLREHEQMLWIGKYRSQSYRTRNRTPRSSGISMVNTESPLRKRKNGLWYDSVMTEKTKVPRFSSIPVSSNASWTMTEGEQSARSSSSVYREMSIPEKAKLKPKNGKSSLFIEF
ncbi:related to glycosyl transferase [Phialocephala subalpina]|uniref:Related to glycosyl transferase n=1 Tax=Phialocephala subalpina TaxID=576137 RepID=A0A1L7X0L7_9HELO|nr:related to glycosyl transferase [Phialocephala subalpina]